MGQSLIGGHYDNADGRCPNLLAADRRSKASCVAMHGWILDGGDPFAVRTCCGTRVKKG